MVQRVSYASVLVDGLVRASIGRGFCLLLAVARDDGEEDVGWMVDKVLNLRIFEDERGKMGRSLLDVGGELLVVSQFTLYGDCRRGRRPSFDASAPPELGRALYQRFVEVASARVPVKVGEFGAHMEVRIHNDGPVTIILDSRW